MENTRYKIYEQYSKLMFKITFDLVCFREFDYCHAIIMKSTMKSTVKNSKLPQTKIYKKKKNVNFVSPFFLLNSKNKPVVPF